MYHPLTIANYFIQKAIYEGTEITPMKVLKLVYIAHGWHLGIKQEPLITEQAQAWKFGPVIKSVYDKFKLYGKSDISSLALNSTFLKEEYAGLSNNGSDKNFLDQIWALYSPYDGLQLSELTHKEGTPWYITYHQNGGSKKLGAIIPTKLIQEHYKEKVDSILSPQNDHSVDL